MSAPHLIWSSFGRPAPEGKTGSAYRFEPADGCCATCAAPIAEGVPFTPRRGVPGIDNDTFHGHAEYARWGTHVCRACAWLYGDPKRTHRGVLVVGERGWWPVIAATKAGDEAKAKAVEGRPRWRYALAEIARAPADTPVTGVLTVDPKPRLWPRAEIATAAAPGLYVHSPDHDWSRWTAFDLREVARALALVDQAVALGATKSACWAGLLGSPKLADRVGLGRLAAIDARIAPMRGSAELLISCLVA